MDRRACECVQYEDDFHFVAVHRWIGVSMLSVIEVLEMFYRLIRLDVAAISKEQTEDFHD